MPPGRNTSPVSFFFQSVRFTLEDRSALKAFLVSLFRKEGKKLESLNYIFCTDKALLDMNRQFLRHDYFTDIITFDLSEGKGVVAEIYISSDRVRDNSQKLGVSFKSEIHRVILHGALHLCGYKDMKGAEQKEMRGKEDFYLNQYFM